MRHVRGERWARLRGEEETGTQVYKRTNEALANPDNPETLGTQPGRREYIKNTLRALVRGGVKALWDFMLTLPALARYRLAGGVTC